MGAPVCPGGDPVPSTGHMSGSVPVAGPVRRWCGAETVEAPRTCSQSRNPEGRFTEPSVASPRRGCAPAGQRQERRATTGHGRRGRVGGRTPWWSSRVARWPCSRNRRGLLDSDSDGVPDARQRLGVTRRFLVVDRN